MANNTSAVLRSAVLMRDSKGLVSISPAVKYLTRPKIESDERRAEFAKSPTVSP